MINDTAHISPALQRFLKSMRIGFIEWHDGISYDLEALKEMSPAELKTVEELILARKDSDWRDVETLAALNSPASIQALRECLYSPNLDARLFAARFLKEMGIEERVEEVLLVTLPQTRIGEGMTYALALIEDYPSERLRRKVLWCSLEGNDSIRVHCAALALFLYGITTETFDTHFPIVYEFNEPQRARRVPFFEELCRMVHVDPADILAGN